MLVQIDVEACTVVLARLTAAADEAEHRHAVVRASTDRTQCSTVALASVPALVAQLRDLAGDLRRRVNLAVVLNDTPVAGFRVGVVSFAVAGDSEDTTVIAALLGAQLAAGLLTWRGGTVELERLTGVLVRCAGDREVVAALVTGLGSTGFKKVTARALESGLFAALPLFGLDGDRAAAAQEEFIQTLGVVLGAAVTAQDPTTATSGSVLDQVAASWLASLPADDVGASGARALLGGVDGARFEGLLVAAPSAAALLMRPHEVGPRFADLAAAAGAGTGLEHVGEVRAAFEALRRSEQELVIRADPWLVGNLDGIPFADRATANRTAIRAATVGLHTRIEQMERDDGPAGWILAATGRLGLYDDLLTGTTTRFVDGAESPIDGHQVVLFDPDDTFRGDADASRFAEVVGDLSTATSVGVLVPGTGANLDTMAGNYTRSRTFMLAAGGKLAVVTYLGGEMPPEVVFDAFSPSYANDVAPHLRDFTAGMNSPAGAPVTVVGHSYGGSVVGAAEAAGMRVDRVLHVESAGIGPGVHGVGDYANPGTDRYSMTAPGDLIELAQSFGGAVHGGDPDQLAGVTRLETGRVIDTDSGSAMLQGTSAHSGVFLFEGSTAWVNILNVMTGAPVMLYTAPTLTAQPGRVGFGSYPVDYPMQHSNFVPPTAQVPAP